MGILDTISGYFGEEEKKDRSYLSDITTALNEGDMGQVITLALEYFGLSPDGAGAQLFESLTGQNINQLVEGMAAGFSGEGGSKQLATNLLGDLGGKKDAVAQARQNKAEATLIEKKFTQSANDKIPLSEALKDVNANARNTILAEYEKAGLTREMTRREYREWKQDQQAADPTGQTFRTNRQLNIEYNNLATKPVVAMSAEDHFDQNRETISIFGIFEQTEAENERPIKAKAYELAISTTAKDIVTGNTGQQQTTSAPAQTVAYNATQQNAVSGTAIAAGTILTASQAKKMDSFGLTTPMSAMERNTIKTGLIAQIRNANQGGYITSGEVNKQADAQFNDQYGAGVKIISKEDFLKNKDINTVPAVQIGGGQAYAQYMERSEFAKNEYDVLTLAAGKMQANPSLTAEEALNAVYPKREAPELATDNLGTGTGELTADALKVMQEKGLVYTLTTQEHADLKTDFMNKEWKNFQNQPGHGPHLTPAEQRSAAEKAFDDAHPAGTPYNRVATFEQYYNENRTVVPKKQENLIGANATMYGNNSPRVTNMADIEGEKQHLQDQYNAALVEAQNTLRSANAAEVAPQVPAKRTAEVDAVVTVQETTPALNANTVSSAVAATTAGLVAETAATPKATNPTAKSSNGVNAVTTSGPSAAMQAAIQQFKAGNQDVINEAQAMQLQTSGPTVEKKAEVGTIELDADSALLKKRPLGRQGVSMIPQEAAAPHVGNPLHNNPSASQDAARPLGPGAIDKNGNPLSNNHHTQGPPGSNQPMQGGNNDNNPSGPPGVSSTRDIPTEKPKRRDYKGADGKLSDAEKQEWKADKQLWKENSKTDVEVNKGQVARNARKAVRAMKGQGSMLDVAIDVFANSGVKIAREPAPQKQASQSR